MKKTQLSALRWGVFYGLVAAFICGRALYLDSISPRRETEEAICATLDMCAQRLQNQTVFLALELNRHADAYTNPIMERYRRQTNRIAAWSGDFEASAVNSLSLQALLDSFAAITDRPIVRAPRYYSDMPEQQLASAAYDAPLLRASDRLSVSMGALAALSDLMGRFASIDMVFDPFYPFLVPNAHCPKVGRRFSADVVLQAYQPTLEPARVWVDGAAVSRSERDARFVYRGLFERPGLHTYEVKAQWFDPYTGDTSEIIRRMQVTVEPDEK